MAWIEYHTPLRDHWKIHRLAEALKIEYPFALGLVSILWLWVVDNAPKGDISRFSDFELCRAMRYSGSFEVKKTLNDCELIDEKGRIHDWSKHGLKYLVSARLRIKRHRTQKRFGNVTVTSTQPTLPTLPNQPNQKTKTFVPSAPNPTPPAAPRKPERRTPPPFLKPLIEEIRAYCFERKNRVDPEKFFNHYESNGWRVGRNPMKDWKAAVRTWERSDFDNSAPGGLTNGQPRNVSGLDKLLNRALSKP